jgi:hypothetical protein
MERTVEASPRFKARIAGVLYLLNILTGILALVFVGRGLVVYGDYAILIAAVCYVGVTLLFFSLFKPVSPTLSLIAALFSLVGCAISTVSPLHLVPSWISPLIFFGFYCLLIGRLIFRSTFLPRILGALMGFGGLGWLTFLSPPLANYLSPWNMLPGVLGELSLTLWLIVIGVNVQRWTEQASAAAATLSRLP